MFLQLLGNKMAHTEGQKCSSEWLTKNNVLAGYVMKVATVVMHCAP